MAEVLDQPASRGSMGGRPDYREEPSPPWEKNTASVPYMSSGSAGLTQAEKEALPTIWARRELEQSERRQHSREIYARDFQDNRRTMSSDEQIKTPMTAPAWTTPRAAPSPPLPHVSPSIPQGPKSAPAIPTFVKVPYSPPLGSGKSWSTTKSSASQLGQYDNPRESRPSITAMPGTMSARERSESRRRVHRSASVDAVSPKDSKASSPSFGKRFKAAFKDMFKREPVDDSKLERIEDRHWTEDEY